MRCKNFLILTVITNKIGSLSDDTSFEKVFKEHFTPLTYYAVKFTKDTDSAKEIVHNVFISLWEKRETISTDQPLRSYLYTSVHNRCLNYLRDKSKFLDEDVGDLDFINELSGEHYNLIEQNETESIIAEAISRLPDRCRQVFKLNRFEDKKYREIASLLNISVKTVEAQISKALRILREELNDYLTIIIIWIITKL
ncbi:MAG: RNA polymerase sigma-70 factor [Bacteroidales bacterium]|nr:RNA polymerase sigma-70 factor [Bacteroidales bacterium]